MEHLVCARSCPRYLAYTISFIPCIQAVNSPLLLPKYNKFYTKIRSEIEIQKGNSWVSEAKPEKLPGAKSRVREGWNQEIHVWVKVFSPGMGRG